MKTSRILIAASVAALTTSAFAQSPPADSPSPPAQQGATFESLDANSDGKISKSEAAVSETVSAQFSHYDKDGNGFIEKAEVTSANKSPAASPTQP
jgi:hypothetical protein